MSEAIVEQVMSAAEWSERRIPSAADVRATVLCALDVYCLDHYWCPWSDISGDPETAKYSDAHGYVLAWALFTVEVDWLMCKQHEDLLDEAAGEIDPGEDVW